MVLTLQEQDPNLWWWLMASGHGQNIAEEALDLCEELTNENKSIKEILTDLIAELRETHRMTQDEWHGKKLQDRWCLGCERRDDWAGLTPWPCPSAEAADRAEARLRGLDAPPNPANERINLGGAGDD